MALFLWSATGHGTTIDPFDPNADVFSFDIVDINAANVVVDSNDSLTVAIFSFQGKTVTLAMNPLAATTTNVTFANGSVLVVGDNTTGTANDGAANTLGGTNGADQLIGLG